LIGTAAPKQGEDVTPIGQLAGWISGQMGMSQLRRPIMDARGREGLAATLLGRYGNLPRFTDFVLAVMDEHGVDEIESLTLALERIKNPLVQPPPAVEVPPTQLIGPRVLQEVSAVA